MLRRVVLTVLLSLCPAVPLLAQVGHDPTHSPFRDIATRQRLTFLVGSFGGNTAKAGVGAQSGPSIGVRFRTRLTGPLDLMVNGSYISSQRTVVDPAQPDSIRRSRPVSLGLITADLGLSLTLTGAKTWHGFAPWVGVGLGILAPTASRNYPGGFKQGAGFTFVPQFGTSLVLSRHLGLELEVRDNTIRYEWPLAYFTPTSATDVPVLASGEATKQLAHNLTLSVGATYHFTF